MKSYKDITYRYLKGQRKRTLLTILGIILSVAMISAIGTIIVSARGAMLKEAIRDNGSYHGLFANVNKEDIEKLRNHIDVDKVGLAKAEGFAAIVETTEEERADYGIDIPYRYIEIQAYDEVAKELLPKKVKEGRLPERPDEIIIEKWMLNYVGEDTKLGDKVWLVVGERDIKYEVNKEGNKNYKSETFNGSGEKEYTIVGFIDPGHMWRGNLVTKGITGLSFSNREDSKYGAYFTINNIKKAQEQISNIAYDLGVNEDSIMTNFRVLRLYAQSGNLDFDSSLMGIVIFIVALIMVSTIAVIYNAFNISVLERISQFGLLRSVGATPKQIRAIVFKEAAILSAISIPIGLVSGLLAMKIVFYIIGLLTGGVDIFRDLEATFSIGVFIISTIVGLATVFLSALGPARLAGKVSPLEAVRNTGELKKEEIKKSRSSRIINKLIGIEGEIARKNLKRNRKRLVITVFSMVISIILFIVFSTFSDYLFKVGAIDTGRISDFQIYGQIGGRGDEIYNKLIEMEDVERVYKVNRTHGEALLEEGKISKKMFKLNPYLINLKENNKIRLSNVQISTIGDENFHVLSPLLKSGSLDLEKLNKENGVLVINNTYSYKPSGNGRVLLEGFNLKVGDKIPFANYEHDMKDQYTEYRDLSVIGVLEKGILGDEYSLNSSINIITTEEVYKKLILSKDSIENPYMTLNIERAKEGSRENILNYLNELDEEVPGLHFIDAAARAKETRDMGIIMSIFIYGFISLIAIISAINIINTISTNIILRTKEIAMIKAVGMTQSGIKKMVAFESIFYGLYGAIIGGGAGIGLTYVLHNLVIGISEFEYTIPWKNVVIACLGALIIAIISGAYPLKRINEKIIVESMKTEN